MGRRAYVPPRAEEITREYIDSLTPLLMSSGNDNSTCYSNCFSSPSTPSYPIGDPSALIMIPYPYGAGGYTVTCYDNNNWNWDDSTPQGKLHYNWSLTPESRQWSDHIATVDGCYLIACTATFGQVGDYIRFYLIAKEDGLDFGDFTLECIIADIKNPGDAGYNEWGHNGGQNVLEFEVESSFFYSYGDNPGTPGWMPEWANRRVAAAMPYHRNVLGLG